MAGSSLTRNLRRCESRIPPVLQPAARAYLLGCATTIGPRLLGLLLQHLSRLTRNRTRARKQAAGARDTVAPEKHDGELRFWVALRRILGRALSIREFPFFAALMVGGSTWLELPLRAAFDRLAKDLSDKARKRLSRWFAAFIAASLSLQLLQSKRSPSFTSTAADASQPVHYAGRTLDLTLFAVTRALDVIAGELWHRRRLRRQAAGKWSSLEAAISRLTDPALFALSSGLIMWAWIYHPSRLPRAYNRWIGAAAAVDTRLIQALQRCRSGELVYGRDTGQSPLLTSMCADYGWPPRWGDPARSVPFPCEMVHMGAGPSCERHAAARFARSFRWAMTSYLPIALVLASSRSSRSSSPLAALRRALLSAARSSAFLAAFIALFYYGVCLARTRAGPRLLGTRPAARQRIDGGVCVAAGCALCGWSILLESAARRKDVALFVAPRALATLLPRRYGREKQWRETVAFGASVAVVFTCARENGGRVRGFLGAVLRGVLGPET